eukprot:gene50554-45929_t
MARRRNRLFLGAVVYNAALVAAVLAALVAVTAAQVVGLGIPAARAAGAVKCPGLCYLPVMFLLQGTGISSANMALHPARWAALLLCGALPAALWRALLRKEKFRASTLRDPRLGKDPDDPGRGGQQVVPFWRTLP